MGWECGDSVPLLDRRMEPAPSEVTVRRTGIHWVVAAAFVIADMAGGGVVTMPVALLKSGTAFGGVVIVVVACSFCYTAHLLAENWIVMKRRWPSYSKHCRKPYPEMAYRSLGGRARLITAGILHVMLFGVSVVYLLLSAKIINNMVETFLDVKVGECRMMVYIAISLLPVTFLKSPQDFWLAVVLAMLTTALAVILIVTGISKDSDVCLKEASIPEPTNDSVLSSLGIFMFAFGGHGVFPTIIHDMRRPSEFTKAAILGFLGVCVLYFPVTILGYRVYGDSLTDSVISSIQSPGIRQAANLFIAIHCVLTLTIVINPLNQEFEHKLNVPHGFGYQRVVIRTLVMCILVFSSLTVPGFGPVLNLIGGTAVALTSAVLPCVFNMCLKAQDEDVKAPAGLITTIIRKTPRWKLLLNVFITLLAIVFGFITTLSALKDIYTSEFSAPCYSAAYQSSAVDEIHCCGHFRNISVNGECRA